MADWKIVALTSCLSLLSSVIVAVITSIVTAKVTQRNDDRKMIQEKRVILYYRVQSRIESLIYDPKQVFNIKYRNSVLRYRPHMELWASKAARDIFFEFYEYINDIFEDYLKFTQEPFPDDIVDDYKLSHVPNDKELEQFRDRLYKVMQADMGNE